MPAGRMSLLLVALTLLTARLSTADPEPPLREGMPEVEVPFGCDRGYTVSQGHAVGSHLSYDTYAWDFRMPDGVPIVAALDGVVRLARGDSSTGGCDVAFAREANYVVLAHGGDLETQYLHFSRVVVKAGDHVKAGQLLGYSGRTGWACGSHLHFKVARRLTDGWNNPSIPARLIRHGDPELGTFVTSPACSLARRYYPSLDQEALARGSSPERGSPDERAKSQGGAASSR